MDDVVYIAANETRCEVFELESCSRDDGDGYVHAVPAAMWAAVESARQALKAALAELERSEMAVVHHVAASGEDHEDDDVFVDWANGELEWAPPRLTGRDWRDWKSG